MRRTTRQRLSLLAIVVALAGFALWQRQHDLARAPETLLALDPATISRIAVRIGNMPTEHYAKRNDHWWRVDGTAVRADDGRLDELARTAAAAAMNWRPASDFDAARIGLVPPAAVLTLDGTELDFGETSVTGPQRFVRIGDRVALVSVAAMPRPPRGEATTLH